jgi:wyosine [tRNA(Phe)-imidazoG37] synthetase (radical SAM superfamily)
MTEIQSNESINQGTEPNSEKLLPQSEVNELIRLQKDKAFTKGYQQALTEHQAAAAQVQVPTPPVAATQGATPQTAYSQEDAERVRAMVREETAAELQRQHQENWWRQSMQQLTQKVNAAKATIPDFDEVTGKINFTQMPHVMAYVNQFPNSGEMLYDLSKNPTKLAAVAGAPEPLMMPMLQELSSSIAANNKAQDTKLPPEPLDQSKPSAIGVDNGTMSLKDMKARYRPGARR